MKRYLGLGLVCLLLLFVLISQGLKVTAEEGQTDTTSSATTEEEEADVVTTASTVNKEDAFIKAISDQGTWIICTLKDLKFDKELIVQGEFHDKDDPTKALYRKIAPYTQDENKTVLERFTLTAPKMIIKSPNTKLQGGTFVGDIYVEANGFSVQDAKVEGNVYFAKEEFKASFNMANKGVVTGTVEVKANVDVVTTASTVNTEEAFINAISEKGTWIIVTLNDLKFDKELVVQGEFRDKNDPTKAIYRKIAPYTQDANKNVLDRFTITAPKMIIKSPNTKLQGGTFVGDIYVEANGFSVQDAKVEGNVYFAKEEFKASFNMANKGVVTGVVAVK